MAGEHECANVSECSYVAQVRALLTSISSILIGLDEEDKITIWNKTTEETFKITADKVKGRCFRNCGIEWPWNEITKGISECRAKNKPVRLDDIPFKDLDGSERLLGITMNPIVAKGDKKAGILILARDITERKRAEEAERERQSLIEAVKSMEQVLGIVGHELRTPLAGLRATLEFIMNAGADRLGEYVAFLKTIHSETIRMADMVNNLLEAARLNSGNARWNWTAFTLKTMCEGALNVVSPLIDSQKVELVNEVEPPDLEMSGDEEGLKRLLINLITNAVKHTKEGFIKVSVSECLEDGNHWVKLKVEDTGEGIPKDVAQKLGQAFVLNSGVVGANYIKGTGLGLTICKGIAAAHGGRISVSSCPGKGTTFTVSMRADLADAVQETANVEISQEVTR